MLLRFCKFPGQSLPFNLILQASIYKGVVLKCLLLCYFCRQNGSICLGTDTECSYKAEVDLTSLPGLHMTSEVEMNLNRKGRKVS